MTTLAGALRTTGAHATDIAYQDVGDGQPVVLIHGWPLSHRMWEHQVSTLVGAGYRCITYDRRGFGDSAATSGGYDYDTFASDLHQLLTHLDLHDVVLVGFSMGGGEVARYLGRYGAARISKVMLLASVTPFMRRTRDNPGGVAGAGLDRMLAAVKADRIGFLTKFFVDFYNADDVSDAEVGADLIAYGKSLAWPADPIATQQCVVAFSDTDFRPDLRTIRVPVLIVHGDADRIVPFPASAVRTQAMIAGSEMAVIAGAPHGFPATHARELDVLLLNFLKA
jgi:non-heme chloroperoxidase